MTEEDISIEASCRICLEPVSKARGKKIKLDSLVKSQKELSYQRLFLEVSGYQIEMSEPQQMCIGCSEELYRSYEFKLKCDITQERLKKIVLKVEDDDMAEIKVEINDDHKVFVENLVKNEVLEDVDDDVDDNLNEKSSDNDDDSVSDSLPLKKLISVQNQPTVPVLPEFQCEYCDSSFKNRGTLRKHYDSEHLEHKIHECQHCKEFFYTKSLVDYHMKSCKKRVKTAEEKAEAARKYRYVCPTCGKLASTSHIKIHTQSQDNEYKEENRLRREEILYNFLQNRHAKYADIAKQVGTNRATVRNVILRFLETKSTDRKKGSGGRRIPVNEPLERKVLEEIRVNPTASLRGLAKKYGTSPSWIHRLKQKNGIRSNKVQKGNGKSMNSKKEAVLEGTEKGPELSQ